MIPDATPRIDKCRARRHFDRAAPGYDRVAALQREIAERLLGRLDYIRIQPSRALDLGAGTGQVAAHLLRRYRRAEVLALDFAPAMLARARQHRHWLRRPRGICADLEALPLTSASIDLIVSNASLQWSADLEQALRECRRVLRPGGLLLFTTFGPDTLKELRSAWAQVDSDSHVSTFPDLHQIGDLLLSSGFDAPVMDADWIVPRYRQLGELLRELKTLGATNATPARPRGLTARKRLDALEQAYEPYREQDGQLPATYEVLYGLAWVPAANKHRDGLHVTFGDAD